MGGKAHVTRTFGPIHFEDLDPHRFEDLVRELIYDFRDWQSIEATGRSGSDAGFDVRAFERVATPDASTPDDEGEESVAHPMEGNRWMIQGKREKEIGPSYLQKILEEVDQKHPPYGYILAASAVFSKESYDLFREALRGKGVMEFYLWGRAELEDMLHQPKNDRILFTFFGISLVATRRTRATEIRSLIGTKNKLIKLLGGVGRTFQQDVLLRDIDDQHYPYSTEYRDFKENPRWLQRTAFSHHPRGLLVHARRYYAYVDREKLEWDFTKEADLLWHSDQRMHEDEEKREANKRVAEIWNYLPRSRRGHLAVEGFIRYSNIRVIDPEGDEVHRYPHLFVEYTAEDGPFSGSYLELTIGTIEVEHGFDRSWKRIDVFPKKFSARKAKSRKPGKKRFHLDPETLKALRNYGRGAEALFAVDSRFERLEPRDVIEIEDEAGGPWFLRVTYKVTVPFESYLSEDVRAFETKRFAQQQIGREVDPGEAVTVVEVERAHVHEWSE